jgi:hypothetical protein
MKHTPEAMHACVSLFERDVSSWGGRGGHYLAGRLEIALTMLRDIANEMEATNYPEIPEGWKLVPVEPTDEMLNHFSGTNFRDLNPSKMTEEIAAYSRMLAAAPSPNK